MADYDKTKEKVLWEVTIPLTEKTAFKIGRYDYDSKGEKLGVVRCANGKDKQGADVTYFNPLGRFTLEEFGIISQAINEKEGL